MSNNWKGKRFPVGAGHTGGSEHGLPCQGFCLIQGELPNHRAHKREWAAPPWRSPTQRQTHSSVDTEGPQRLGRAFGWLRGPQGVQLSKGFSLPFFSVFKGMLVQSRQHKPSLSTQSPMSNSPHCRIRREKKNKKLFFSFLFPVSPP